MCVEERLEAYNSPCEYDDDRAEKFETVQSAIWGIPVLLSNYVTSPSVCSISFLSEAQRVTDDEAEHSRKKKLLISQIWCNYSDK